MSHCFAGIRWAEFLWRPACMHATQISRAPSAFRAIRASHHGRIYLGATLPAPAPHRLTARTMHRYLPPASTPRPSRVPIVPRALRASGSPQVPMASSPPKAEMLDFSGVMSPKKGAANPALIERLEKKNMPSPENFMAKMGAAEANRAAIFADEKKKVEEHMARVEVRALDHPFAGILSSPLLPAPAGMAHAWLTHADRVHTGCPSPEGRAQHPPPGLGPHPSD